MNKVELVDAIAKDTGLTKKDAEAALKSFIDNVNGCWTIQSWGVMEIGGYRFYSP